MTSPEITTMQELQKRCVSKGITSLALSAFFFSGGSRLGTNWKSRKWRLTAASIHGVAGLIDFALAAVVQAKIKEAGSAASA